MNNYSELVYRQKIDNTEREVSIKFDWDANIFKVAEELYGLLIAAGYHPSSICKILNVESCDE